jgi:hypothetical protein
MVPATFAGDRSMTTAFRPRLWTSVGAALLLGACSGEAGHKADEKTAAPSSTGSVVAGSAAAGEAGESAAGEGGAGEAGAAAALTAVAPESRTALRLAHLRGFLLIAQKVAAKDKDAASILVAQGMTEAFDAKPEIFRQAGVDEAALKKAASTGAPADVQAALASLDKASARSGGKPADVVRGMVEIAAGLYGGVAVDGGIDPVEYQHSYGAALSAKQAYDAGAKSDANLRSVGPDLDKFLAMWPAVDAPEDAKALPAAGKVKAQASRIELALSGM